MNWNIGEEVRRHCADFDVDIGGRVELRFRENPEIAVEESVHLRGSQLAVDLIGAFTYLGGRNTFIRHVHVIGRFCSIAPDVVIGEFEHPTTFLSAHPIFQNRKNYGTARDFQARNAEMVGKSRDAADAIYEKRFGKVVVGNDVWIGLGAMIRRGVEIGDGAIIGAHAVVTKDVPPYAIVAGNPARVVRYRFPTEVIDELMRLQWWLYGLSAVEGVDFTDVDQAIRRIDDNIASGRAQIYLPKILSIGPDSLTIHHRERVEDSAAA